MRDHQEFSAVPPGRKGVNDGDGADSTTGLSQDDRLRIEANVKELRSRLEEVPVYANVRPFPVSVAS
jgi:hypothetical protein